MTISITSVDPNTAGANRACTLHPRLGGNNHGDANILAIAIIPRTKSGLPLTRVESGWFHARPREYLPTRCRARFGNGSLQHLVRGPHVSQPGCQNRRVFRREHRQIEVAQLAANGARANPSLLDRAAESAGLAGEPLQDVIHF
jgi:hypothetical protein